MSDSRLSLSASLSKKAAKSVAESVPERGVAAFVPFARIAFKEIVSISADNVSRTIRVEASGNEYDIRGWPPRNSTVGARMGSAEKHDPNSPGSPTQAAADEIASAAGLVLQSDPRAQFLHYARPFSPGTRFEPMKAPRNLNETRIRPWKSLAKSAAALAWIMAWFPLLQSLGPGPRLWAVAAQMALVLIGTIWQLKMFLQGVTINAEGITGFGKGHKLLPWSEISLLHVRTDTSVMFGRGCVSALANDGNSQESGRLSKRQANRLAEALVRFGTPWGVKSSVYVQDFSRKPRKGINRVESPIGEITG